jgi:hypothetical protein
VEVQITKAGSKDILAWFEVYGNLIIRQVSAEVTIRYFSGNDKERKQD